MRRNPQFVAETVEAVLCEPLSPRAHGLARDADLGGDCAVIEPIGGEQNDLRALRIATPDLAPPNETVKIGALMTLSVMTRAFVALPDPTLASATHATVYRIRVAQSWLEISEAGH